MQYTSSMQQRDKEHAKRIMIVKDMDSTQHGLERQVTAGPGGAMGRKAASSGGKKVQTWLGILILRSDSHSFLRLRVSIDIHGPTRPVRCPVSLHSAETLHHSSMLDHQREEFHVFEQDWESLMISMIRRDVSYVLLEKGTVERVGKEESKFRSEFRSRLSV